LVETMMDSVVELSVGLLVTVVLAIIAYAVRKVQKLIENVTGIDLAERETRHIARTMLKLVEDYEELYVEVLNIVESRLEKKGINFEGTELADIVYGTLQEIVKEKEDGD